MDEDCLCPWCIADGSAYRKYDLEFTDIDGIGGYGDWEDVSREIKEEVAFRTPGFMGWQQERWWTCCGDAAAFIGYAGRREVEQYGPQLEQALQKDVQMDDDEWSQYLACLDKDGAPLAYIFKCLKCGKFGGYSDTH